MHTARIEILPAALANQIAAGEVIERPSSVIKELIENSLDANSDEITIVLIHGGLKRIEVSDNGLGIVCDDLPLAFLRHGTSKIKLQQDLTEIQTLGFRGEALASIAAVAKVTLLSCAAFAAQAWETSCYGTTMLPIKPCARSQGTSIIVEDLFFNVPARRAFLKSEKTELQHIQQMLQRLALSHFDVSFTLIHNNKVIWKLPKALSKNAQEMRIQKLWGRNFLKHAIQVSVEHGDLALHGWLTQAGIHENFSKYQQIYINQRMVRDRTLTHAMKQAYTQLNPHFEQQPGFLLFLELPAASVDVNVHPTKHEVRFREQRLIHDFVVQAVKQALAQEQVHLQSTAINLPDSGTLLEIQQPQVVYQSNVYHQPNLDTHNLNTHIFHFAKVYMKKVNESIECIHLQNLIECVLEQFIASKNFKIQSLLFPCSFNLSNQLEVALENYLFFFSEIGLNISQISLKLWRVIHAPDYLNGFKIDELIKTFLEKTVKISASNLNHQILKKIFLESVSAQFDVLIQEAKRLEYYLIQAESFAIPQLSYKKVFSQEQFVEKIF